jgi:hypothetical protein
MTNHVHLLVTPNDTVGPPLREWLLLLRIIRCLPPAEDLSAHTGIQRAGV